MAFWKESTINRLSNLINRNRLAAKISQVLFSSYSPISSQKEVEKVRKRIMAVNKEDWAFLKMNIHQNKQGKSKDIPKETTVLLVKDLTKYITKLTESESEQRRW